MTERMNQLISNGGDCRTAPATPGLLKLREEEKNIFVCLTISVALSPQRVAISPWVPVVPGIGTRPAGVEAGVPERGVPVHCTVLASAVQCWSVQNSTVQYSTVQPCFVTFGICKNIGGPKYTELITAI